MQKGLKRKIVYILIFILLTGIIGEKLNNTEIYAGDITVGISGNSDYLVSTTEDTIVLSRYHRRRDSSVYWTYKTVGFVISLSALDKNNIEDELRSGKACEIELISNNDIYNTNNVQSIYTIDKNSLCEAVDMLGIDFEGIETGQKVNVYISNVFVVYKRTLQDGVEVKAEYESESLYNRKDMDEYLYKQAGLTWGASGTNIDQCYNNTLSVTWNIKYGVSLDFYDAETGVHLEEAAMKTGMPGHTELFRGQEWEISACCDEFICNEIIYSICDSFWTVTCNDGQSSESGSMVGRIFKWRHTFADDAKVSIWCEPVGRIETTPEPTKAAVEDTTPEATPTLSPSVILTPIVTLSPTTVPTPTVTSGPTPKPVPQYEIRLEIEGTNGTGWVKGGGYVKKGKTTYINTNAMENYSFLGWYLEGKCISTTKGSVITVNGDATYIARYEAVISPTPVITVTETPVVRDFAETVPCITEKPERIIKRALQSNFIREGEIVSDTENGSHFDVRNGIAVQEYVAAWFYAVPYILEYDIEKVCGKLIYDVEFRRNYVIEWKDSEGKVLREEQRVSVNVPVERSYSYWRINNFEYYTFSNMILENEAFNTGIVKIDTIDEKLPDVKLERRSLHIQAPEAVKQGVDMETCVLRSETTKKPQIDMEELQLEAVALIDEVKEDGTPRIDEIRVFNDVLVFDGISLFETYECEGSGGTVKVEVLEKAPCFDNVGNYSEVYQHSVENKNICKNKIELGIDTANGEYKTKGKIVYKAHAASLGQKEELTECVEGPFLNIFVHTPVYCKAVVESDNDKYVQLVAPVEGVLNLVIDENSSCNDFMLRISNYGEVRVTQGMTERDFSRLMRDNRLSNIQITYEEGCAKLRNELQLPFGVFVDVGNNYDESDDYFVEAGKWITVGQGKQRFYTGTSVPEGFYKAKARTVAANCGGNIDKEERNKNSDYKNYVAIDFFDIRVSGRVFGMEIDIIEADGWETERGYMVGELDEYGMYNGSSLKERLPLCAGSDSRYAMAGVLKKGTVVGFNVETTGDAEKYGSFVVVKPRFYHVDEDGRNRKEADMYYDFFDSDGKKHLLVLSGGAEDERNYIYGETLYDAEKYVPVICGYSEIILKSARRTELSEMKYKYSGFYTLPEGAHFVEKNFDVYGYCDKNGITYKEDFWLTGGYIIVNFDISVYDGNYNKQLSYINDENKAHGMMNMWAMEVNGRYERTDAYGNSFLFEDGDTMLFYTDKNMNDNIELKPVK